jgi:hypothetical protein
MVGHKWEPAEGAIINSHYEQMELPGKHGMHRVPVYEIDIRAADGTTGRARVPSAHYDTLRPGTIVRLEISGKNGEIRLWAQTLQSSFVACCPVIRPIAPAAKEQLRHLAQPQGAGSPVPAGQPSPSDGSRCFRS